MAVELRNRFSKTGLTEVAATDPEVWAKESFEIATKIAYRNGALRGTPKGQRADCGEVIKAGLLPNGYAAIARKIADRHMMLAGFRLADLCNRSQTSQFRKPDLESGRIKSDTPPSRIATPTTVLWLQNIGFHYIWTVPYPLP